MKVFTNKKETVDYLQTLRQRLQDQCDAGDIFPCEWDTVEALIFEIDYETHDMPKFTKYVIAENMSEYKAEKGKEHFYCDEDGSDYFKKVVFYEGENEDPYILIFVDTSWLDRREIN